MSYGWAEDLEVVCESTAVCRHHLLTTPGALSMRTFTLKSGIAIITSADFDSTLPCIFRWRCDKRSSFYKGFGAYLLLSCIFSLVWFINGSLNTFLLDYGRHLSDFLLGGVAILSRDGRQRAFTSDAIGV